MIEKPSKDLELKEYWDVLVSRLTEKFSDADALNVEGILYLVGLQELGKFEGKFKKDDNVNLMHVGICTVLEPYGHYRFTHHDEEGWPHFELITPLPNLKPGEQAILMKQALVDYFKARGFYDA